MAGKTVATTAAALAAGALALAAARAAKGKGKGGESREGSGVVGWTPYIGKPKEGYRSPVGYVRFRTWSAVLELAKREGITIGGARGLCWCFIRAGIDRWLRAMGFDPVGPMSVSAWETGWLAKGGWRTNNLFGISHRDPKTRKWVVNSYNNLIQGLDAFGRLMFADPRYIPAIGVRGKSEDYLHKLYECGYNRSVSWRDGVLACRRDIMRVYESVRTSTTPV